MTTYRVLNQAGPGPVKLFLAGPIDYTRTAPQLLATLRRHFDRDIELTINSEGGSLLEAEAIASALRSHNGHVTVVIKHVAASAATVIAMAADRILIDPDARMMIHPVSAEDVSGDAVALVAAAEALAWHSEEIAKGYAERAGGTVAEWRARMKAETWFTAQEAVDLGLADALTDSDRLVTVGAASARGGLSDRQVIMYLPKPYDASKRGMLDGYFWGLVAESAPDSAIRNQCRARATARGFSPLRVPSLGALAAVSGGGLLPEHTRRWIAAGIRAGIVGAQLETGLVVRWR